MQLLQSSSFGCWQDWVSCSPLNWVLSLLAVGSRPPSFPCDMCFSIRNFITWQPASSEQQGRRTKERRAREKSVFYSLALKVTHPPSLGLTDQAYRGVGGHHTRTRIPGDSIMRGNPGGRCTLITRRTTHLIPCMQMRKRRPER